ncbi:hypothetical protein LZ11_01752 [Thermosediminibacter litoriperuensis]|uniref:HTH IS21-type domain-containing protein n=1 Tax=Thermosediminibacter litoriperuensis TaxID=291989 RepID=A0A5S5ALV6_9FIRM|nr:hypothetical protein LZ11_01752 [Thermosediminibacter litoriperuensis]
MLTMTHIDNIRKAFFMKGQNISEIAREFQKDRKTIRKYIYQEDWNTRVKVEEVKHTFPKLDPFKADIDQWLVAKSRGIPPKGFMTGSVKNTKISLTVLTAP